MNLPQLAASLRETLEGMGLDPAKQVVAEDAITGVMRIAYKQGQESILNSLGTGIQAAAKAFNEAPLP